MNCSAADLFCFLPFVDGLFQLGELVAHSSDVLHQALSVTEGSGLAQLGTEGAESFQLTRFLLQLRPDLLKKQILKLKATVRASSLQRMKR